MVVPLFKTDKPSQTIDCREMVHPEPLERVLEAVELLDVDNSILMVHHREPFPLYPILAERNCSHETKTSEDGTVQVLIWKK